MQAAITARQRGHEVTLYEKASSLGGMLHTATALPFKDDMRRSVAWLIRQTEQSGAKLVLNTEVDADLVRRENPDALILAVGARPFTPPIPGHDQKHVVWAGDIDTGRAEARDAVAVIGAGLTGLECAINLSTEGKTVTVMDQLPLERWCGDAGSSVLPSILYLLEHNNVRLIPGCSVSRIEAGRVVIDLDGEEQEIAADTVAMAAGMRACADVVERLSNLVRYTWVVGDGRRASNIMNAIHGGFQAAMDV